MSEDVQETGQVIAEARLCGYYATQIGDGVCDEDE